MRFRKRRDRGRRRLLFVTDLHASELVFRKFLNAVSVYEADLAIVGGDLTGKRMVPLVETEKGVRADVLGRIVSAKSDDELAALDRQIRNLGFYPLRTSEPELAKLKTEPELVEQRFVEACHGQVEEWMERAAERLRPLGVPLYVTGGNDDYFSIEAILDRADYAVNAEGRVVELPGGIEMISTGYGNPTPWNCPRDISEDELAARIEAMAAELRDSRRAIFNLHVPPFGSGLDICPRLDTSTEPPRPIIGEEAPAGSTAVRSAIERFEPQLSLHGHIHESPGIHKLGVTTSVNPGSEYGEGVLRSAVLDLTADGEVVSAQLLAA